LGFLAVVSYLPARTSAQEASPPSAPIAQSQSTPSPPAAASGPAPASAQAAVPGAKNPTPKEQRQAEKLYLRGAKALEGDDPRGAYGNFTRATALDPGNRQYTAAQEIARQHLVTLLVQEADKARLSQHPEVSRERLQEALALDPKNPIIGQHVEELAADRRMVVDPQSEAGGEIAAPIELAPANVKKSFHLKGTQQEILRQILSSYQITAVMDSSVTQQVIRIDVDDVDYAQAAQMAKLLTGTFFVPLDPKRVLVAKDTRENRTKFERLLLESIYLPGLSDKDLTDISNVAKTIFEAPVATLQPTKSILTVRAPETKMKALNATLEELLDGRAQVILQVQLYDINTTRTTNVGVSLPSQTAVFNLDTELNSLLQNNQSAIDQIISSGLAAPGDYAAILAILIATGQVTSSLLTQGFLTFGGGLTQFGYNLGTVTGNLSLNNSDARALDDIQLRVLDQETATFRVGTRYPIVTSTYSSGGSSLNVAGISSAGVSSALSGLGVNLSSLSAQVTIPQIQYEDLGLTLKATPRVQHGAEVALNMDLKFTALGGSTLDGNPILNNRQFTATITLKDGASALIVSNLSKQETKAVTGLPGLNELPGLRSATDDSKNVNISNLIILVTPRIVRGSHVDIAGRQILLPRHD
jgi:type II secretory pathway component GspD/PulD (secretin)